MIEFSNRYPKELFVPERLIGRPVLEAFRSLVLANPEVVEVKFLTYVPGQGEEFRSEPFWLNRNQIATGELDRIANQLPPDRVLALYGFAALRENCLPHQWAELSFNNGSGFYGLFPMIDYECPPSPQNLAQIRKDLTERLVERWGIIAYSGRSCHYIGGCLMTHWLDVAAFCGVQLQLNEPDGGVRMTDTRNIGHELAPKRRPVGRIGFSGDVAATVTFSREYRLDFILRSTAGGIKPIEPEVVDVIYEPPISHFRIVSYEELRGKGRITY